MIMVFQFSKPDRKLFKTRHIAAAINDQNYKLNQITDGLQTLFLPILFLCLYLHPQITFIIFIQQIKIKTGIRINSSTFFFLFNLVLFSM